MRSPERAVPVAQWFFACSCILFFASAILWDAIVRRAGAAVAHIASLSGRRYWMTVVATAAALRGLAAFLPYEPNSDAGWYHQVAAALARGEGFVFAGQPTAYRSPAYPFALSLLYRFSGPDVRLAWVIGIVSTAVLLVSVHSLARQLFGEVVARVAGILVAIYPALVLLTGQAMSDLPFVAALFALLAWLARHGLPPRRAAVTGFAVGLLTLLRTVAGPLALLLPIAFAKRAGRFAAAAVCISAAVACVLPWMARNSIELGSFTIGTNGGSNLLTGTRPGASGWRDAFDPPPSVMAARGEVARDRAMLREAADFVREHPLEAVAIMPGEFVAMYLLETGAVTSLFQGQRRGPDAVRYVLFGISQLSWALIAGLVLARIASWRFTQCRPKGPQWCGWILVAYFTLVCLVFHGQDRYRLPLLPWFLIEAAVVVCARVQPRNLSIRPLSSSSDAN
jgi:4-amino-4-deoxy-L-arabinose transferase-like glycosyltransferase